MEGTCFTIDVEGKQYVVTAKHVIDGHPFPSDIDLHHDKTWKPERAELVGFGPAGVEVAVMVLARQLSPTLPLEPSCTELFWGQDVHFLGFPYGHFGDVGQTNGDFPIPFVKRAAVSSMSPGGSSPRIIYLDGFFWRSSRLPRRIHGALGCCCSCFRFPVPGGAHLPGRHKYRAHLSIQHRNHSQSRHLPRRCARQSESHWVHTLTVLADHGVKADPIAFNPPVTFDVRKGAEEQGFPSFQAPFFRIENNIATCLMGNHPPELFRVMAEGYLKTRGVFGPVPE